MDDVLRLEPWVYKAPRYVYAPYIPRSKKKNLPLVGPPSTHGSGFPFCHPLPLGLHFKAVRIICRPNKSSSQGLTVSSHMLDKIVATTEIFSTFALVS